MNHANVVALLRHPRELQHSDSTIALLALRGWACDRYTDRAMIGAGLFADRLAERLGVAAQHLRHTRHAGRI